MSRRNRKKTENRGQNVHTAPHAGKADATVTIDRKPIPPRLLDEESAVSKSGGPRDKVAPLNTTVVPSHTERLPEIARKWQTDFNVPEEEDIKTALPKYAAYIIAHPIGRRRQLCLHFAEVLLGGGFSSQELPG